MMRKFYKKKAGRRGAILVTVVFVLAFAVIFIAAAMVLTQATRKRVYTEAESNQARLTVTSVAESWLRAVQMCEFDDTTIYNLCKAKQLVNVYASANADDVPGLQTEGSTSLGDNYTTVQFGMEEKNSPAKEWSDYRYIAKFQTHIGNQVESVRAELSYSKPTDPEGGTPFSRQIDYNGEFSQSNLAIVGDGLGDEFGDNSDDHLDNIFLVRKGGMNQNNGFSTKATMVYCDGNVSFNADSHLGEDVVFLTGAKLYQRNGASNFNGAKNWFFFGDSGEDISANTNSNFESSGKIFYLCNRTLVESHGWHNHNGNAVIVKVDKNGNRTDSGAALDAKTVRKVQRYALLNDSYKKGGSEEFPTTDKFLASMKNSLKTSGGYTITKTAPTSGLAYKGSFGKFLSDNCYQTTSKKVPGGVYVFDDDKCDQAEHGNAHPGLGEKEPYIMCLDADETYHFWFKGNKTYNPRMVVFVVYGQDKTKYKDVYDASGKITTEGEENPVLFLLEDKAKIYWPGKNGDTDSDGAKVGNNGILSVQGRNLTSASAAYTLVHNLCDKNGLQGPAGFEDGGKGYSQHYNGKNKPWVMIIGMGHNTVKFDKYIILEAFIGLYNTSYSTPEQSHLIFRNGETGVMYGRLMTDGYSDFDGGDIKAPAAPGSNSFSGGKKPIRKLVTGFSLDKMIYYYGT